jgi:hypothetical protein
MDIASMQERLETDLPQWAALLTNLAHDIVDDLQ